MTSSACRHSGRTAVDRSRDYAPGLLMMSPAIGAGVTTGPGQVQDNPGYQPTYLGQQPR